MLIIWILIFIVSLVALVKGSDWLIESAEKIGLSLGLSPFIVGVTIVGIGTSFPELASSLVAVLKGVTDVVSANVIGSNIANILLIVGISSILAKRLSVSKNLIDLDLPLLAICTAILLVVVADMRITLGESILMLVTYGAYLFYTIYHKDTEDPEAIADAKISFKKRFAKAQPEKTAKLPTRPKLKIVDFVWLILGLIGLVFGAKYLIDALVIISSELNIGTGVIAITAVAVGTSLPELLVSAKAALQKKPEVALGNIFGSNIFNSLVVTGVPGLFSTLHLSNEIYYIGVPMLIISTLLFIISGISRRIHLWEGSFFLALYVLFMAKLFNWF